MPAVPVSVPAPIPAAAEIHDGFIRVIEADHHADFHLRWLRHHGELGDILPDPLTISEATIDDGVLRVRWTQDQRVSRFPLAWLHHHAYAVDRAEPPRPP